MNALAAKWDLKGWWPASPLIVGVGLIIGLVSHFGSSSLQFVGATTMVNLIIVLGLYIFIGNSGIISFGHLGFTAIGAYGTAILTIPVFLKAQRLTGLPNFVLHAVWPTPMAVIVSALAAALFAALVSIPLGGLNGLPAGIATLSVLVIVNVVVSNATTVTGGQSVLVGIPLNMTLLGLLPYVVGAILLASIYQRSSFGLRLRATREDSVAALALGINVKRERRLAIVLSAFVCAIGGGLYGHVQGGFDPSAFYIGPTTLLVVMLVVGGTRSLSGAVLGTLVVSTISELLRQAQSGHHEGAIGYILRPGFQPVCLGLLFLGTLILRPRGLTNDREIPIPKKLAGIISRSKLTALGNDSKGAEIETISSIQKNTAKGKE